MAVFNKYKNVSGASSRRPKPSRSYDWKKLTRLFQLVVLVAVVVVLHQGANALMMQPVSRVIVNGDFVYADKQAVVAQVEPFLEQGFLLLDLVGVRDQLLKTSWIYDVSVSRRWPDEIVLNVREQKPIARWGETAFLNYRGELFKPSKSIKVNDELLALPFLKGPDNTSGQVMNHFRELNNVLNVHGMELLTLELDNRSNWHAQLTNGIHIVLGDGEVMEKMSRLLIVYKAGLDADFINIEKIDMRYSNGFAVAWRTKKSLKS
jgi:cell division protein FtsQ